jgi:hypothetical protein
MSFVIASAKIGLRRVDVQFSVSCLRTVHRVARIRDHISTLTTNLPVAPRRRRLVCFGRSRVPKVTQIVCEFEYYFTRITLWMGWTWSGWTRDYSDLKLCSWADRICDSSGEIVWFAPVSCPVVNVLSVSGL